MSIEPDQQAPPTRSEVGEYIHDMAGQLAVLAREAGLTQTADALVAVRLVVECEF